MKVVHLTDLKSIATNITSQEEDLINWSVYRLGQELSFKVINKPFPKPNMLAMATILTLHKAQPRIAESLLKQRCKLPDHSFMMADPQERQLRALSAEHNLCMAFKTCQCRISSSDGIRCSKCGGLKSKIA
jgi:coenzyme F420-reducing hydrogenase gamma subunit